MREFWDVGNRKLLLIQMTWSKYQGCFENLSNKINIILCAGDTHQCQGHAVAKTNVRVLGTMLEYCVTDYVE